MNVGDNKSQMFTDRSHRSLWALSSDFNNNEWFCMKPQHTHEFHINSNKHRHPGNDSYGTIKSHLSNPQCKLLCKLKSSVYPIGFRCVVHGSFEIISWGEGLMTLFYSIASDIISVALPAHWHWHFTFYESSKQKLAFEYSNIFPSSFRLHRDSLLWNTHGYNNCLWICEYRWIEENTQGLLLIATNYILFIISWCVEMLSGWTRNYGSCEWGDSFSSSSFFFYILLAEDFQYRPHRLLQIHIYHPSEWKKHGHFKNSSFYIAWLIEILHK